MTIKIFITTFLMFPICIIAQKDVNTFDSIIQKDELKISKFNETQTKIKKIKLGDQIIEINSDSESKYQEYVKYVIDYHIWSLENRRNTLLSSTIIFFVVVFIVFSGVYFSWLQFSKNEKIIKRKSNKNNEKIADSATEATHSLKASLQGIEISSSFVGLIILVISMGFFYLYLIHVYPIEYIQEKRALESTSNEKKVSQ